MCGLRQNSIKFNNPEINVLQIPQSYTDTNNPGPLDTKIAGDKLGGKERNNCLINLQDFLHLNTIWAWYKFSTAPQKSHRCLVPSPWFGFTLDMCFYPLTCVLFRGTGFIVLPQYISCMATIDFAISPSDLGQIAQIFFAHTRKITPKTSASSE
jgi:hypothetical protein